MDQIEKTRVSGTGYDCRIVVEPTKDSSKKRKKQTYVTHTAVDSDSLLCWHIIMEVSRRDTDSAEVVIDFYNLIVNKSTR